MPKPKTLKDFHFSCGDSGVGPVGFCATVRAYDEAEALAVLQNTMPVEFEAGDLGESQIIYFNFYTNPDAVTVKDIDEVLLTEEEDQEA